MSSQKQSNNSSQIVALLVVIAVGSAFFIGYKLFKFSKFQTSKQAELFCDSKLIESSVSDNYMEDRFKKGQKVKILMNALACDPPKKGDIVLFQISSQLPPSLRYVRGVPGDRYQVIPKPKSNGIWEIKINGKHVKAGSENYYIKSKNPPALRTMQESRNGVLLQGEFILFGNSTPSISDSSNLGVIKQDNIIGKLIE